MDMIVIVLWLFFHGQIPILSQMCREQHSATAPWGAAGGKSAPQSFPVKAWALREKAKRRKGEKCWALGNPASHGGFD